MKKKVKILLDIILLLCILILMGFHLYGEIFHEIIGTALLLCTILHNTLNLKWYLNIAKGKYNKYRAFLLVINLLLLLSIIITGISGVMLSRYIFAPLNLHPSLKLARAMHMLGSTWSFLLVSLHLGFHLGSLVNKFKTCFIVVSLYGLFAFFKRDFLTYLFLRSEFMFFNYDEAPLLFYIDYVSIIGLASFIVFLIKNVLLKRNNSNEKTPNSINLFNISSVGKWKSRREYKNNSKQ